MNVKPEQLFYWMVWIGSVFYSLGTFVWSCHEHVHELETSDFIDGWLLNLKKDNSDLEWNILTGSFKKYWLLLIVQVFFSQLISRNFKYILPLYYVVYSTLCLMLIVGWKGCSIYLLYIGIMVLLHSTGKKMFCYALTLFALSILHSSYVMDLKAHLFEEASDSFLFEVGLGWLLIKCLSFAIDRIESGHCSTFGDLWLIISYCFYLPIIFTGPLLTYSSFAEQVTKEKSPLSWEKYFVRMAKIPYFLLWYLVFELLLHLVYSSAVQYNPTLSASFSSWALCGLGYALPMMFFLKYFIVYGLAGTIADLEDVECPPPPKCITAIHSSSYLYRHFDRGLYIWILRYLYHPLVKKSNCNWWRKLLGLFISFSFVCMWHGAEKTVCMWTFLNLLLVAVEGMMKPLLCNGPENYFHKKKLSSGWQQRASALLGTLPFILTCISCTFFLSNWDIGVLLGTRVFGGLIPFIPVAFFLYCGCHVSLDVTQRKAFFSRKETSLQL